MNLKYLCESSSQVVVVIVAVDTFKTKVSSQMPTAIAIYAGHVIEYDSKNKEVKITKTSYIARGQYGAVVSTVILCASD